MRLYHFTEQPYPAAWNDPHGYLRVDIPNRALDPISKMPEFKVCACKIEGGRHAAHIVGELDFGRDVADRRPEQVCARREDDRQTRQERQADGCEAKRPQRSA